MSAVPHRIGDIVRLVAFLRDGSLDPATGLSVSLKIRRTSDGNYWNGSAFVSGVQTVSMTEVDDADEPGYYLYSLDTTGFSEGHYTYRITYTVDGMPLIEFKEFLVGQLASDVVSTLQTAQDIETDTQDIQSRLPATLNSGRMRAHVEALDSDTVSADALASDAVSEIQSGLATAAALASLDVKVDALSIPSTSDITSAILAMQIETGLTFKQCMQACFAALAGVLSGADTNTVTIKGKDGSTRITATVDENGNRSAIVFSFE